MLKLLVLILSPNIVLCVDPVLVVPIKQFGEACGYDACPVPMSRDGLNVHIVPHSHYELAFTRTFAEHYTGNDEFNRKSEVNMKRTLDTVITEMWSQSHRRFTISDFPYFFHWWSQRDENVRRMVHALVRQGRISFVGGGWSMNDEATTNYHAVIDSFTYSLRKINSTFWECGRPLVAWQADVLGHSREFASLVAQMGYDAMFINPISFDDELARMRRWALEMVWRGSDDLGPQSDIFTHKLFDGIWAPPGFCFSSLCKDPLIITSSATFSNAEQRAKEFEESIYNRQAPNYNSSHVMVVMGSMLGYFDASYWFANIDALINTVNSRRAVHKKRKMYLMYSSPACYAKAVHSERIAFETKQDDFYPVAFDKTSYLTGLYTSSSSVKLMAREVTVYLQMCKQLGVLAMLGSRYNKLFEELNWIAGVFQDHAIIGGVMADRVKNYYVEKMYVTIQKSTMLLKAAWNQLRRCPDTTEYYRCAFNASACHTITGDYYFLHIHNVLAWAVTVPVRIPIEYFGEQIIVYDPTGKSVQSAIIRIPSPILNMPGRRSNPANYEVVFRAEKLPPLGFKTYFMHRILPKRTKRENESKQKREIVKHLSKSNKKYLIRQAQPLIEEKNSIYDLEYEYEEGVTERPLNDKSNVTLLLESDADEEQLQQLTEVDNDKAFKRPEDVLTPSPEGMVPQEESKIDIQSTTPVDKQTNENNENSTLKLRKGSKQATRPMQDFQGKIQQANTKQESMKKTEWVKADVKNDTLNTRMWSKVVLDGRMNELVEDMKPHRTTTPKYDNETSRISIATYQKNLEKNFNDEALKEIVVKPKERPNSHMEKPEGQLDREEVERQNAREKISEFFQGRSKEDRPNSQMEKPDGQLDREEVERQNTRKKIPEFFQGRSKEEALKEIVVKPKERPNSHMEKPEGQLNKEEMERQNIREKIPAFFQGQRSKEGDTSNKASKNYFFGADPGTDVEETVVGATTERDSTVDIEVLPDEDNARRQGQDEPTETQTGKIYEAKSVKSNYIENKHIRVIIDQATRKITSVTLSNGVHIDLDIQFYYYPSDDPDALDKRNVRRPGAVLFRAMENTAIPILDRLDVHLFKTAVVEEAHVAYSDWTSLVLRLYADSPVIEVEWLVGPVPIDDGLGKEVFIRYLTDLVHEGVFYTDSNGRQTVKRIRNMRPMYESMNQDHVAGNFYPVTSKFSIEDLNSNLCFSVFVDRAQGATSLVDGEVDLMLQRRILTDDTASGFVYVNDTENGKGVVIRGKHHLYISRLNHKPYKIFEKIFAKEKQLPPQVFVSHPNPYGIRDSKDVWYKSNNEVSFLKTKLPIGVHLLTLEQWNDDTILLRLENFLEKNDTLRVPTKKVFIRQLFTNIYINKVRETTLGANVWLEDSVKKRLKWRMKENFVESFNGLYGVDKDVVFLTKEKPFAFEPVNLDVGIRLAPQQIRTFVCWFDYVEV